MSGLWLPVSGLLTVIRHNEGGANKDLAKFSGSRSSPCAISGTDREEDRRFA